MHDLTRAVHAPADLRADEPDVVITRLDWSGRGAPIESHESSSSDKEQKMRLRSAKPSGGKASSGQLRTATTLNESFIDDMALTAWAPTNESEAANSAPILRFLRLN